MTTATTRPVGATGSPVTSDPREPKPAIRTTVPSGWYDPDGAAWESEPMPATEALRAMPLRSQILAEGPELSPDN